MKFIRFTLLIGIIVCMAVHVTAAPVSPVQARQAAKAFFLERINQYETLAAKDLGISSEREVRKNGVLLYYVFNFNRGGWTLVSGDDRAIPVIAYGFSGAYDDKSTSCCQAYWMHKVEEHLATALAENRGAYEPALTQWIELLSRDLNAIQPCKAKDVEPLLLSTWDQGRYYNTLCPAASDGPDGHAVVGCVATSMSQVMYYYRWPLQGLGSHDGLNLASYYYRWNEMQNNVNAYNQGVAELCYHAGVTVDMSYSGTGSGAQTSDIPGAAESHFRYSTDCESVNKMMYTSTQWANLLISNLDAKHPLVYSGTDPDAYGHAWNCDGYQGSDYFHMNWGWSGAYNGYYYLNNLTAGGSTFSDWHQAVINFYPPTSSYPVGCTGNTVVPYTRGSIVDGSGPNDYGNNSSCQWLIDPTETVAKIEIDFYAFSTESTNDVVTIYNGDNTSAPVLGTFSGATLPTTVTTTGDKALVVFTSNSSSTAPGWYLEYRSFFPVYCSGITTLTTPTGTVTDGSGANDYSYNHLCRWVLSAPGASAYTIDFTEFSLAADDFVMIYDYPAGNVIGNYTGSTLPPQVTVNSSQALIFFKSDAANNAPGFNLNYTAIFSGVAENPELGLLMVYPNPASGKVTIELNLLSENQCTLDLLSPDGRLVMQQEYHDIQGSLSRELDLSSLRPGVYFLRISAPSGRLMNRLVVQ